MRVSKLTRLKAKTKWYGVKLYEYITIQRSCIFDKDYYLFLYPDIKAANLDPLWHYLVYGFKENRNPHPIFNTEYYLRNNPDVQKSTMNPLVHYIRHGDFENRRPHPLFDNIFYREFYKDELSPGMVTLLHYLQNPKNVNLRPHPLFHTQFYLEQLGNVDEFIKTPLETFLTNSDKVLTLISELLEEDSLIDEQFLIKKDILIEDYIRHVENDPLLREALIERFKQKDFEGMDYYYNRSRPVRSGHVIQQRGQVLKVRALYDYAKDKMLLNYESESKRWVIRSNSLQKDIEIETPNEYICTLKDIFLVGGTRLIIKEDVLLHDELAKFDHCGIEYGVKLWNYTKAITRDTVEVLNTKTDKRSKIKKGILLSCDHDNNYFHWMVECMAKATLIKESGLYQNYPILISKSLHENFKLALTSLVGREYSIFELEDGMIYQIDQLVVPSDLSRVLDKYSGEYKIGIDIALSKYWVANMRNHFLIKNNLANHRKLYLSRKSGTYRKLVNEAELEIELLKKGFEIIELTNCSLEFQIELFSQADIVVAPTGATLTNMLFMPFECSVVVLTSDHEYLPFNIWEQLASICDLKIQNCKGKRMYTRDDFHDDYEIDIIELLELV